MKARVKLKISGRVQGVFYRQSTLDKAKDLGLAGWVANKEDASVIVEAQGEKPELESLIAWCWQGPPSAQVKSVELEWQSELDDTLTSFKIIR